MKNNKGFTLIELLVAIVILGVIIGIGVVSYRAIIKRVEKNYYETLEQDLLLAGSDYFNNHREEKPFSGYRAVHIDELVGDKYIDPLKDRSGKVCSPNNDSKVYIYKTNDGYDYEACLYCDADYPPTGNYCKGNILGEIVISAKKETTNTEYNVLKMSYDSTGWSNENIVVSFKMSDKNVTKYRIVDVNDNSEKICNATDNSCSMTFSSSGSYTVEAYDNETVVGTKRSFHVKIDKEKPVCEFISGPSVELINKSITSTYELECTDNNIDTNSITVNNFSQTKENTITIQNITSNNITDGYKYIITVVGNLDGETKLKLNEDVIKDKAGNGNVNALSNEVNSDVTAPVIDYSLASGTYDENKTVTITVTDNYEISSIEYKLYKDDELVSSGNSTGDPIPTLSLDSDGVWRVDVTAIDEVSNKNTSSRSFIIATTKCDWFQISYSEPNNCTSVSKPDTPSVGDTYTKCYGPLSGKWRYRCSKTTCGDGFIIYSGPVSDYKYDSSALAEQACATEWGLSGHNACISHGGASGSWSNDCNIERHVHFEQTVFEYQCN